MGIRKPIKKLRHIIEERRNSNFLGQIVCSAKDSISKVNQKFNDRRLLEYVRMKGKKSIYIRIQKVAGTSLMNCLKSIEKKEIKKIDKRAALRHNRYFKFAFTRNPYDRLVSCYINKILNPYNVHGKAKNNFLRHNPDFHEGMDFKSFAKEVSSISDNFSDRHIKSQHCFLLDKKGRWIPDFLGKFENLEEDFKKICKKMGVSKPPSLPHKRKSKRIDGYRDYYDEETKRLVERRYKKDLELFGYKF